MERTGEEEKRLLTHCYAMECEISLPERGKNNEATTL